jgi:hypothetical protein
MHTNIADVTVQFKSYIGEQNIAALRKSGHSPLKLAALAGSTVWLTGTRSGNVRAIVSYEPGSGFPFPEGEVPEALPSSAGPLVPLTAQLLGC